MALARRGVPFFTDGLMSSTESVHSRKNPFRAALTVNRKLTGEASQKETRHFELSLAGSGLQYEAGDSLGVFPSNNPALVDLVIRELGFSGGELVPGADGVEMPLREALTKSYILGSPSKQLLQAVSAKDNSGAFLNDLLNPEEKTALENFLWGRDVLDVLQEFHAAKFTPEEFVKTLRKLQPRLYSIASSQKAVGESVHLTIAVVRYSVDQNPREREGVCSTFLADRSGGEAPVFVHTAKHFRMPENPDTPMIMVGPGTGVAPFRAFLQERKATGAKGRNWLFFGDQRAATDFLYREELEAALADGSLHRLDTAFSRDQEHKIYVQHRMLENGRELFDWIDKGAYFFVCGDANRMAKDVDAALHTIVETHGGKSPEAAREYLDALKKEKRYRKDVY
jgi:sulfite reductase (NADPH) flavoprotein alpha-component